VSLQQYNEAAVVYEKGQFYDRAAAVCLKAKNWYCQLPNSDTTDDSRVKVIRLI
jgi:hypothetical protein